MDVHDTLGRPMRDLRVSVTDRCNLRCTYCMPREVFGRDFPFLPRQDLLTYEQIERVVRACVRMGVAKVRLTGGEPLLRRDLHHLVGLLALLSVAIFLQRHGMMEMLLLPQAIWVVG